MAQEDQMEHLRWIPPSRKIAQEEGRSGMFAEGRNSLFRTRLKDLDALGVGTTLYFILMRYFAWFLVVQSIIALPSLILFSIGNNVEPDDADLFRLSKTTLANFHAPNVAELVSQLSLQNSTTLPPSQGSHFSSYLISFLDVTNMAFFAWFIGFLRRKIDSVSANRTPSTRDYAVFVEGLPHDATAEEVAIHFSNLFQLSEPDWEWIGLFGGMLGSKESRTSIPKLKPVIDTSNSSDDFYEGSWVCEVAICHSGEQLRLKRELEDGMLHLRELRALQSKRGKESAKLKNRINKSEAVISRLLQKLNGLDWSSESEECHGAFVIFNHRESRDRCLDDFQEFSKVWHKQPEPLRFRQLYPLIVTEAPAPSNFVSEHVGTSIGEKLFRNAVVVFLFSGLLFSAFLLIYSSQALFQQESTTIPNLEICELDLPATFTKTYSFASTPRIHRDHNRDAECSNGTVWLSYAGVMPQPTKPCSSACIDVRRNKTATHCFTLAVQEGCPSTHNPPEKGNIDPLCMNAFANQSEVFSPMLPPTVFEDVEEIQRVLSAVNSVSCCKKFFLERALLACFCSQKLKDLQAEKGLLGAFNMLDEIEDGICADHGKTVFFIQFLSAVPAIIVVIANGLTREIAIRLVRMQRNTTITSKEVNVATGIFLVQFVTTALVILVLNASRDRDESKLARGMAKRIFADGKFDDFTRAWYAVVGQAILFTMFLNIFAAQMFLAFLGLVFRPVLRWYFAVVSLTQERLNKAFVGMKFRMTIRYAFALNTIFVTELYSTGMPLILPCAALYFFVSFAFDFFSLLRWCRRPPAYDESFAKLVVGTLPFALLGHALFSFWALGNGDLVPSGKLFDDGSPTSVDNSTLYELEQAIASIDRFGVRSRAKQIAAFPQFCISCVLLAFLMGRYFAKSFYLVRFAVSIWKRLLFVRAFKKLKRRLDGKRGRVVPRGDAKAEREICTNFPPFTEPFTRVMSSKTQLPNLGEAFTWRIKDGTNVAFCVDKEGRKMLTWQVIATNSEHSYKQTFVN